MTAEVAIVNSSAVAIAADSAVTIGRGKKIYNSAIKVFSLSKTAPVGIMVYGNAGLLGVPWETIIKIYRAELKRKPYATLEDYASDFFHFLSKQKRFFSDDLQLNWVESNIRGFFNNIRTGIFEKVELEEKKRGVIDAATGLKIFSDEVALQHANLSKLPFLKGMSKASENTFIRRYRDDIKKIAEEVFQELKPNAATLRKLNSIAALVHSRDIFSDALSGVVICGFGSADIYPVVVTHQVEGVCNNKLKHKYRQDKSYRIKHGSDCSIIPFAQEDMVASFMEGMNPAVNMFIHRYLGQLFLRLPELINDTELSGSNAKKLAVRKKLKDDVSMLLKGFFDQLKVHKRQEHIDPIISMVRVLPKDELAAMAEALVNLTAFKRRMTDELETVGGPIDVAVISKGDGLVWVKRKHYFKPELNQHFFANYFREM